MDEFVDLQLNVKGMKNLYDSFRDYVAVETLDGENKYQAEGYGLQDAKKGIIFQSFPPVLHLQLKRFEYDVQRDAMVKVRATFTVGRTGVNSQFADQRSARISFRD
jgi:ubiquitin carboxyl-terminal hydrolase 7